jgi:hypothetical protein
MSQPRIVAVDGGTYFHRATLADPRFASHFDAVVYAPELAANLDWMEADCLYVASRQDPALMQAVRQPIADFLAAGKTVVAMGESQAETWLPGVAWHASEVNFWWWLTPGADSGLRVGAPGHGLFRHIALADATWHQHGYLDAPPGAVSLVDRAAGGSILYEDRATTAGRILATTLDPCYHHGSNFMPATTRFLTGFLPWLRASLADNA